MSAPGGQRVSYDEYLFAAALTLARRHLPVATSRQARTITARFLESVR
ncbi:hypothetical protein [Micromonospora rhizosphaerae]|nr:hypothetical protein [Micromonospora rhizosphaerae]